MSKTWLTASELAGLPGMPSSAFRTRGLLERLGIPSRLRAGREGGGGREYDAEALPLETRRALLLARIDKAPTLPAPQAEPAAPALPTVRAALPAVQASARPPSRAEAACADGRVVLVRRLIDMAATCSGITEATTLMAELLARGEAEPALMESAQAANKRARAGRGAAAISARTLFRWYGDHKAKGWHGLLPAPSTTTPLAELGDDVAAVLKAYASAQGAARNLTEVTQDVNRALGRPFDDWRRLYDQARRALPKVDHVRMIKARHTGAERAARLPFKRRDTSPFKPLDICLIDGHSFKAKVQHPDHGQPFAPEVTIVKDAATRMITGWSASLSETTIAVGDALRHSVAQHGVHALAYTDNGPGESGKQLDCPVVGLFARMGTEHRTGIPSHPQGHGLMERGWRTHMIRCARQFATYQGSDVDSATLRKVSLELAREKRAVKRAEANGEPVRLSTKAPTWRQFLDAVALAIHRYNTEHRHRGLPKHTSGPHAGLHMTPAEAWEAWLDPADQVMLDAASLRNLFMPAKLCTAIRGEVRFLNQFYASPELMHGEVDGKQVRVHYDIHDATRVWVWTLDGQFVCEAKWNANRIDYFPTPVVEIAKQKRVQASVKLREQQIETAMRELTPTLDAPQGSSWVTGMVPTRATELVERVEAPVDSQARPAMFDSASDRYEWLMRHRDAWQADDRTWLARYAESADYEALADYYTSRGLDWSPGDSAFKTAG